MCGLAGIFQPAGQAGPLARDAARMTAGLVHRGPDAEGVWSEDGIALGHRRLAILDLSPAGAQPMEGASGRFVMAFNGEIYNHLVLRELLENEGAAPAWRGHSDTETLLAAIAAWGLDRALEKASGMFALALWDRERGELSLARDRIGEKPLFWGWAGDALVFGSELRALRAHSCFDNSVCPIALAQYLRFAYVPAPRSIHPGVYKLEPGTILTATLNVPRTPPAQPLRPGDKAGGLTIRRYWSAAETIAEGRRDPIHDPDEALERLSDSLLSAVRGQMLSDVPLGGFLSGGVDSSAIVAMMQAASERPVRTFTIGFEDSGFDEAPHAEAVAAHLGTDHSTRYVTADDAKAVIPQLPAIYDEPFADSSQIPTFLLCETARRDVTVALSGDGGDELFGGYNRYIHGPALWRRMSRIPAPGRKALGRVLVGVPGGAWDAAGAAYNRLRPGDRGIGGMGDKVHKFGAQLADIADVAGLHRGMASIWGDPARLVPALDRGARSEVEAVPGWEIAPDLPAAPQMMLTDMRTYLPDDILCKVDRAAMAVSLETRVPFLDPEVIALSARLPLDMKLGDGTGKAILRRLLYRHVPRELIERPKAGFSIPIGQWLRGPLQGWAEDLLDPAALARDGLLDPVPIRRAWAEHLAGRRDRSRELWVILMFQAWRERWA